MNRLEEAHRIGQSIWLDQISRGLITSGELKRLVDQGLRGMTSNPTIFEKAISGSTDYDAAVREILAEKPDADAQDIFERLAIEDVQAATDVLRAVYESSDGADGFVSLEVSPHLAHDTEASIAEAKRLWQAVSRPNLMIKIPATREGIPAIEDLLADGVNVNATLMFSLAHYEAVANAYIRGVRRHPNPARLASVASFFVSRVDTAVDKALEKMGSVEALSLKGKTAIANTKMAYRGFREVFHDGPFQEHSERGARLQRPLWGSTSTKNPAYSDVLYVDELMGPDTVNTTPLETLRAFQNHGRAESTLLTGLEEAESQLATLARLGIDLDAVTDQLQVDGVAAFADSFDKALAALDLKRREIKVR
jgi:transaldolase